MRPRLRRVRAGAPGTGAGLRAVPAAESRDDGGLFADRAARSGRLGRLGRSGRVGLVVRRLAGVFVTLALLGGTIAAVSLTTAPARALDIACHVGGGSAANVGPENAGIGSNFWLPKREIPGADKDGIKDRQYMSTLWEVVGNRGLLWSYSPKVPKDGVHKDFNYDNSEDNFENSCSPVDASAGYLAQLMFEPSRFLGGLTIGLKELAIGSAPFSGFYSQQNELIDVLRAGVFQPALVIGVIAAGLWVMTRFRRQDDQRETYSGIIWSAIIVVLVSAALFGNNIRTLSGFIDGHVDDFNEAALNSMTSLTEGGQRPDTSPCMIMDQSIGDEGTRRSSCMLYELLLYNPWALGQFGTTEAVTVEDLCYDRNGSDLIHCEHGNPPRTIGEKEERGWADGCIYSPYRCKLEHRPRLSEGEKPKINLAIQQIISQAYTNNEAARGEPRENPNGDGDDYTTYERLWRTVQFAVADEHPNKYMMWKGSEPTARMATAASTVLINIIVLLAVGFVALLTVFWHGVMFVAWILLPVVGAVAAFPPARRIFAAYFGIIVQAVFLRMVLGLMLAVLLAIMNAINIETGGTGLKIILMIIAAAALWKLLTSIRSGQTAPSVVREAQGQGTLPSDQQMTSSARRSAGWSGRVAVGGAAGGVRGARAGYTTSDRQGWRRVADVVQGSRRGAASGGANATRTGRQAQWSSEMGDQAARKGSKRDKTLREQRERERQERDSVDPPPD